MKARLPVSAREDCAPVAEMEDFRHTRRVVDDHMPSHEELAAEAARHLELASSYEDLAKLYAERVEYHRARASELLEPLNRILTYRHEAEAAVDAVELKDK